MKPLSFMTIPLLSCIFLSESTLYAEVPLPHDPSTTVQTYTVPRDGLPHLRFQGELIGSNRAPIDDNRRNLYLTVYAIADGRFLFTARLALGTQVESDTMKIFPHKDALVDAIKASHIEEWTAGKLKSLDGVSREIFTRQIHDLLAQLGIVEDLAPQTP